MPIRIPILLLAAVAGATAALVHAQGWPQARGSLHAQRAPNAQGVPNAQGAPNAQGSPQGSSAQSGAVPDSSALMERQDFGVPPTRALHGGAMHAPTPSSIPGGQTVTTPGLLALLQGGQAPYVLLDVLGGPETLPGAVPAAWMAQPGSFDDGIQRQVEQTLERLTRARKDVVLVFYCLSPECWMSYNASLRAIHAGYRNVLWYRGGVEAWKLARLPTAAPGQQAATAPPVFASKEAQPPSRAAFTEVTPGAPAAPTARGAPGAPGASGASGAATARGARGAPGASAPAARPRAGSDLRIGQTRFFSFAQPPGWRIGEEGQFALTQVAPDGRAYTLMVGNAGLPVNYPPDRFAYEKFSALRPQNLQFGPGRQATPAAGFRQAVEYPVSYVAGGVAYRGVAKVSVAPAYDTATMALTAALSAQDQWDGYASWLPQVADLVSATNGAAFGMRGIMQQNLRNSVAFGQAAQEYRDWSQKNWQGVVDQRDRSLQRRNLEFRENLGAIQTWSNPYGTPPVELPTTNQYYWTDRQGRVLGTNDPTADPNIGSTAEWRRMERLKR